MDVVLYICTLPCTSQAFSCMPTLKASLLISRLDILFLCTWMSPNGMVPRRRAKYVSSLEKVWGGIGSWSTYGLGGQHVNIPLPGISHIAYINKLMSRHQVKNVVNATVFISQNILIPSWLECNHIVILFTSYAATSIRPTCEVCGRSIYDQEC